MNIVFCIDYAIAAKNLAQIFCLIDNLILVKFWLKFGEKKSKNTFSGLHIGSE